MHRSLKLVVINAAAFCAIAGASVAVLGGVAAENAMRPPRLPVALVCPCFAHMHCESTAVKSADRTDLRGWYYTPDTPSERTVILLHGVGSNRQDMVALGYVFLRHGYSVLEPDLRGHGESGGLATYGVDEEGDIRAWLDWIERTAHPQKIYGFGASLGAAVLLDSLKHETRFKAVVAESSYYDFPSVARERISRMLPTGLKWVSLPFVSSGVTWARWHDGIDLRRASAAEGIESSKVPVLLIHGLEDGKTSPENSRRLAELHEQDGGEIRLWLVPGSGHADAWKTTPAEFESRVTGWFSIY